MLGDILKFINPGTNQIQFRMLSKCSYLFLKTIRLGYIVCIHTSNYIIRTMLQTFIQCPAQASILRQSNYFQDRITHGIVRHNGI